MRAPVPSIPFIYLRLLCTLLAERGYDSRPWLLSAEIDPSLTLNPEGEIPLSRIERLLAAIEVGTGRVDWGFHLGKALKLTSHGAVGFVLINAETVGEVVRLSSRYYRLMNPLYTLSVVTHGRLVGLEFRRAMAIPERCRRFYDETIAVSVYQQLVPFLKERPPRHFEIRLGMLAPPHLASYAELRGANVIFGDADNDGVSIFLDAECMDIRNPLADANSRAIAEDLCRRRCEELDQRHGWADWVAKALRTADGNRPTQSDLAALLHMSPRTLERALAREGASFKDIYERVGFERACEMLRERRHSISAIAERLGYSSIGAFSRAFKRRSGLTPSDYLAQQAKT